MAVCNTDHNREPSKPKKRFPWGLVLKTAFKGLTWLIYAVNAISKFVDIDKMFEG